MYARQILSLLILLVAAPAYGISQETLSYLGSHWWEIFMVGGSFIAGFSYMEDNNRFVGYLFFTIGIGTGIYLAYHNIAPVPDNPQ